MNVRQLTDLYYYRSVNWRRFFLQVLKVLNNSEIGNRVVVIAISITITIKITLIVIN